MARSIPHRMRVEEVGLQEEQVARSIPHQRKVVEEDLQVAGPSLPEERVSHQFLRRKWVEEVGLIQAGAGGASSSTAGSGKFSTGGREGRDRQLMEHPQTRKRVGRRQ